MPLAATTTKLHITSNDTSPTNGDTKDLQTAKDERDPFQEQQILNRFNTAPETEKSEGAIAKKTPKNRDTRPESRDQVLEVPKTANESASWLGWFSKSEITTEDETSATQPHGDASSAGKTRPQSPVSEALQDAPAPPSQRRNSVPSPVPPTLQQGEVPRSWLSLWGNTSIQTKSSSSASAIGLDPSSQNHSNGTLSQSGKVGDVEPDHGTVPQSPQQSTDGAKPSYGWAFWSRDQPKSDDEKKSPGSEVGELALAGSSFQSKPESAVVDEARGVPKKVGKRQRPQSLEVAEDPKKPRGIKDDAKQASKAETVALAPIVKPTVDAGSKAKRTPENLLLPSFKSTYSTVERPSLIQQISKLLQLSSPSESKHVDIVQKPARVKRALAIVSLPRSVEHGSHDTANLSSVGCSWLFSSTIDSIRPGSTNRHVYPFCQ